jgi:hypothetical protein
LQGETWLFSPQLFGQVQRRTTIADIAVDAATGELAQVCLLTGFLNANYATIYR